MGDARSQRSVRSRASAAAASGVPWRARPRSTALAQALAAAGVGGDQRRHDAGPAEGPEQHRGRLCGGGLQGGDQGGLGLVGMGQQPGLGALHLGHVGAAQQLDRVVDGDPAGRRPPVEVDRPAAVGGGVVVVGGHFFSAFFPKCFSTIFSYSASALGVMRGSTR